MPRETTEGPQALHMRLPRSLKASLEQAAGANGRSINAEVQARLEASFAQQETLEASWGGRRLLELTRLWNASFRYGGALGSRAWGHPEWEPDEWLGHPLCYRTARAAADDELDKCTPQVAGENAEMFNSFVRELAPHIARGQTIEDVMAAMRKRLEGEP